ncbi:hypothetical protein PLESTF_000177800 [Pleodorina starrii]|nr:hypothetical protein PLESTF_000177800 [Pleodorina starrii]
MRVHRNVRGEQRMLLLLLQMGAKWRCGIAMEVRKKKGRKRKKERKWEGAEEPSAVLPCAGWMLRKTRASHTRRGTTGGVMSCPAQPCPALPCPALEEEEEEEEEEEVGISGLDIACAWSVRCSPRRAPVYPLPGGARVRKGGGGGGGGGAGFRT